jgi:hypothetical protein
MIFANDVGVKVVKVDDGNLSGVNLIKLLGAYLGAYLNQVNGARRLNKPLKVL